MTRTTTIVTLAILSSILTPVVVSATGATQKPAAPEPQARIEKAVATTSTQASAAETPACARKVKVVYGGFGEVHAAACAATAEMRR